MREIKFRYRVKSPLSGFVSTNILTLEQLEKGQTFLNECFKFGWEILSKDQYAGRKDGTTWNDLEEKERKAWTQSGQTDLSWIGKEIYKGDIIKICLHQNPIGTSREIYNGEVIFVDGSFCVSFFNPWKGSGKGTQDKKLLSSILKGEEGVIIGNIHENPELLEERK